MQKTSGTPSSPRRSALLGTLVAVIAIALATAGFFVGRSMADEPEAAVSTTTSVAPASMSDTEGGAETAGSDLPETAAEAQAAHRETSANGMAVEVLAWNRTYEATVFDLEGDGDLDLFYTVHNVDDDPIWIQDGGFRPSGIALPRLADEQLLLVRDRHACDAADVDADGDVDLYCTIGFPPEGAPTSNELWLQGPDGSFSESSPIGAEDPEGRGRFVRFLSLDGDDLPDLYVTNHTSEGHGENRVYRNDGNLTFTEVRTEATGVFGSRCTPVAGDWNGDGLDDLATCPARENAPILFENRGGTLAAADGLWGENPPTAPIGDVRFRDIDGDGNADLIFVTDDGVEIRRNDPGNPDSRFETRELWIELDQSPRSLDLADLDGDGHLDIYVARQGDDCRGVRGPNGQDVVLLGPDWEPVDAPYLELGCSDKALAVGPDAVLVINSFNNRPGAISIVRAAP